MYLIGQISVAIWGLSGGFSDWKKERIEKELDKMGFKHIMYHLSKQRM